MNLQTYFAIGSDGGSIPIPALACSEVSEFELPSTHSPGYRFQPSQAFNHISPAPASVMLVPRAS